MKAWIRFVLTAMVPLIAIYLGNYVIHLFPILAIVFLIIAGFVFAAYYSLLARKEMSQKPD